jgi:hypothetical protein
MERGINREYIYALFFDDFPTEEHLALGPVDAVFYVGRTKNLDARLSQHRSRAKSGTEAKYAFIRELEANGTEWDMKVLIEVEAGDHRPHERLAIINELRQGANLKNMRQGDLSSHLDGLTVGQLRQLADDLSVKSIEDLITAEAKIRKSARKSSSRDPGQANLRTQIKAMKLILMSAPTRLATKSATEYRVFDMGEGQDSVWAEVGMPLQDVARLIAPMTREKLSKLLKSDGPV